MTNESIDYLAVAEQLAPQEKHTGDWGYWYSPCDYDTIVKYIGKVAVQASDDDYQGSTYVLYDDPVKGFGYLCFGWGSCSGCDALQACDSNTELAKLIQELDQSVSWKTKEELLKYMKEHDWEGDWSYHYDSHKKFVVDAIKYLEGEA